MAATLTKCCTPDPVRKLCGEACVARIEMSGQSSGNLLEDPAVTVRIAEGGVRGVTFPLRIWATDQTFRAGVVEYPTGVVKKLADLDATAKQFVADGLDVGDDQVQPPRRTGRGYGNVFAEGDRASGAGRRELDHPVVIPGRVVEVESPAQGAVEALGAIDVRDRDNDDL